MIILDDIYDAHDVFEERKEELFAKIGKDVDYRPLKEYEQIAKDILGDDIEIDREKYRVSKSNRLGTFLDFIIFLARDKEEEDKHYIMFIELKVEGMEGYSDFDALKKLVEEKTKDGSLGEIKVKLQDAYCDEILLEDL